jgi:hypothetical protein
MSVPDDLLRTFVSRSETGRDRDVEEHLASARPEERAEARRRIELWIASLDTSSNLEFDRAARGEIGMLPALIPPLRRLARMSTAELADAIAAHDPSLSPTIAREVLDAIDAGGSHPRLDDEFLDVLERILGERPGSLGAAARVLDLQSAVAEGRT